MLEQPQRLEGDDDISSLAIHSLVQKAYLNLQNNDSQAAIDYLDKALSLDFNNEEVLFGQKCTGWWLDKLKNLSDIDDDYDKSAYILSLWKPFYSFERNLEGKTPKIRDFDACRYAIKHFVYKIALEFLDDIVGEGVNQHDPALLLSVGRCFKGTGDYENALNYLEQAARFRREDALALSELADVNALLGQDAKAKVLFREAFYLAPLAVDIDSMESELILRLREKVESLGYTGDEMLVWLPVYGKVLGVFSAARVLKTADLRRLSQDIFSLENEIRLSKNPLVVPSLLNKYFWMLDHYSSNDTSSLSNNTIEQTKLKIKLIAPDFYAKYMS
jgi:tetratricopeptide (TPR) repeat protein